MQMQIFALIFIVRQIFLDLIFNLRHWNLPIQDLLKVKADNQLKQIELDAWTLV